MCEELSYQIINTSAVNKNHYRKENSVDGSKQGRDALFYFLGFHESLKIHIFNLYKALYSASSSTFRHLDIIRAVRWHRAASPMVSS